MGYVGQLTQCTVPFAVKIVVFLRWCVMHIIGSG